MKVKATVLCENYVTSNLGAIAEHGWSVFLETNQGNFLFDTGQGKAIINNAQVFKINLTTIQGIMLSHHHTDHTGGLLDVLGVTGSVNVYAHTELFKDSYLIRGGREMHIGIPFCRPILESKGANFRFNTEWQEIVPGLSLTGEIPRNTTFEKGDKDQVLKTENGYVKDPIMDDQSVVIETKAGLFIILGCAHAGIINILNFSIEKTGQSHIHAVIGGTHLGPVSEKQREKSIDALKEFDIERIGVSHCSGLKTSMRLAQEFGERFFFCNVGSVVKV
ncbi:MAG: MBL fold metallo-hydrolase [Proteobacteria bacterium]|nr:MBL fold metallo-hydrolase [Pseudomonadota bacterium]